MALKGETYGSTTTTTTTSSTTTATAAPTNVQVIAPATLHAGYTFDAMYDGVTFTVTVPEGGVVKGQRFIVPFVAPVASAEPVVAVAERIDPSGSMGGQKTGGGGGGSSGIRSRSGIPTGVWRDSLCDCCRFGPCHPHFLNAWLCRTILIGQILTRMKMTWLGRRDRGVGGDQQQWKNSFRNLVILTVVYFASTMLTSTPEEGLEEFEISEDDELSKSQEKMERKYERHAGYSDSGDANSTVNIIKSTLNGAIEMIFGIYLFYILIQLRATLRNVYSIPQESCLWLYNLPIIGGIFGNNPREGLCGTGNIASSGSGSTSRSGWSPIGWEDICCAFWCPLCIAAQMARHTVDYEEKRSVCCNSAGVEGWEEDEAYLGVDGRLGGIGEGSVLVV